LTASLAEASINNGINQRSQIYLERSIPLINMIAERLKRDLIEYHFVYVRGTKEPDKKGGYWVNEIIKLLDKHAPDFAELTNEKTKALVRAKMWLQVETKLEICLAEANLILSKLAAGPRPASVPQVNESLIRDAERFLGLAEAPSTPVENKIKNVRQSTRFVIKRKRRTKIKHGNEKETKASEKEMKTSDGKK
jgi:hypothetical protein